MTPYLSKKFRTASFLLMVLIVFLHSYNLVVNYQHGPVVLGGEYFNFLIQKFISDGIGRIAVPVFFAISGYLFFTNVENFNSFVYKKKLRRRTRTVLLPFLLWSFLAAVSILIVQKINFSDFYFYKYVLGEFSFGQWLDVLFLHPINYQLWFLQVLFLLVFISPFIYWLIKFLKGWAPILLLLVWLTLSFSPFGIPFLDGLVFFSLGAYCAISKVNINIGMNKKTLGLFYILWGTLIATKIYFEVNNDLITVYYIEKAFILVGVVCFWFSIDHVMHPLNMIEKKYSIYRYSFFIFLFHEPTLVAIKKLLIQLMGVGAVSNFITYLAAPTITIFLAIFVGKLLKRKWTGLYNLLTGYR